MSVAVLRKADLVALFDKAKADGKAAISQDGDIPFYNMYFFTQLAERYVGAGGLNRAATDKTGRAWQADPGVTWKHYARLFDRSDVNARIRAAQTSLSEPST